MSKYFSHLASAEKIIRQYGGEEPLAIFLKHFFAQNKQMGSRDRKSISRLCYQFFRLGHYGRQLPVYEKIIQAAALFPLENEELLKAFPAKQNPGELYKQVLPCIFPYSNRLSEGVDVDAYTNSFLKQPALFLRIRPDCHQQVIKTLEQADIEFALCQNDCVQLNNTINVEPLLPINKWVVIQDRSSQQTGKLLHQYLPIPKFEGKIWDCCAASGGKSIMMKDYFPNATLTVSDVREGILKNLHIRFRQAAISHFIAFVADLSRPPQQITNSPFDVILADVPCTGSGTWSRTPESLYFFNEATIEKYQQKQLAIVRNALPFLKQGGYLVYITCSVFAAENEEVIKRLQQQGLSVMFQQLIAGYDHLADSLFFALLRKD